MEMCNSIINKLKNHPIWEGNIWKNFYICSIDLALIHTDGEGEEKEEAVNDLEVSEESDVTDSENDKNDQADQTGLPNDPFVARFAVTLSFHILQ